MQWNSLDHHSLNIVLKQCRLRYSSFPDVAGYLILASGYIAIAGMQELTFKTFWIASQNPHLRKLPLFCDIASKLCQIVRFNLRKSRYICRQNFHLHKWMWNLIEVAFVGGSQVWHVTGHDWLVLTRTERVSVCLLSILLVLIKLVLPAIPVDVILRNCRGWQIGNSLTSCTE